MVTGDLVNRNGDAAQVAEYKRIAALLNPSIPLSDVQANHDEQRPTPADIVAYRAAFGRDYYSFVQGSVLGIVLNSIYLHSPQNVPQQAQEQETITELSVRGLKKQNAEHVSVFIHRNSSKKKSKQTNIPI